MHRIEDVVFDYERLNVDEEAHIHDKNYAFPEKGVPGSPKHRLTNVGKDAQHKNRFANS